LLLALVGVRPHSETWFAAPAESGRDGDAPIASFLEIPATDLAMSLYIEVEPTALRVKRRFVQPSVPGVSYRLGA
jgi:hypothetical protein